MGVFRGSFQLFLLHFEGSLQLFLVYFEGSLQINSDVSPAVAVQWILSLILRGARCIVVSFVSGQFMHALTPAMRPLQRIVRGWLDGWIIRRQHFYLLRRPSSVDVLWMFCGCIILWVFCV